MTATLIGYARCSTDKQDLTANRNRLLELGVAEDRIYLDRGLTGTSRARPGLDQALAAVRTGDTLVVPKLDRLARSVPDARDIGDTLAARGIRLSLGARFTTRRIRWARCSSTSSPPSPLSQAQLCRVAVTSAVVSRTVSSTWLREAVCAASARSDRY
jgi:hypothetical protein